MKKLLFAMVLLLTIQASATFLGPVKLGQTERGTSIYRFEDNGNQCYLVEKIHTQITRSDSVAVSVSCLPRR